MSAPLADRVALVSGATRGGGRGIAVALGEAGATVYATWRSTRERRSEVDRPETIEEAAELETAAGGERIAVAVDHLDHAQVAALVDRIIKPARAAGSAGCSSRRRASRRCARPGTATLAAARARS